MHRIPAGGSRLSFEQRMASQGFAADELASLAQVSATGKRLAKLEEVAFAATQGLFDPATNQYVNDGPPQLEFAGRLVHGADYNALRAELSAALAALIAKTDERTQAQVRSARTRLQGSIVAAAAFTLLVFVVVAALWWLIRRRVLSPLVRVAAVSRVLAAGDYSARNHDASGGAVGEVQDLAGALDGMAQAIDDDLRQREQIQAELRAAKRRPSSDAGEIDVLANMSHEIRTPMNAMIGMAYLALRTDLTPRQRDYVGRSTTPHARCSASSTTSSTSRRSRRFASSWSSSASASRTWPATRCNSCASGRRRRTSSCCWTSPRQRCWAKTARCRVTRCDWASADQPAVQRGEIHRAWARHADAG